MGIQLKISLMVLCIIFALKIEQSETKCYPVQLQISAEFREKAYRKIYAKEVTTTSSSYFNRNFNRVSGAKSKKVSFGVSAKFLKVITGGLSVSGESKRSWDNVVSSLTSGSAYDHHEQVSSVSFNEALTQVYRYVTTVLSIDGEQLKVVEKTYVDSVPIEKSPGLKQLREYAEEYIRYNYGHSSVGQIRRNAYTANKCVEEACVRMVVATRGSCTGTRPPVGWFEEARCCGGAPGCRSTQNVIVHKDWKTLGGRQPTLHGYDDVYEPCIG